MGLGRLRYVALNAVNLKVKPLARRILDEETIQTQIIKLNTQNQLYNKGVGADGIRLGSYAPSTIRYKTTMAAHIGRDTRTDHVTLKDTGDFYRSFKVKNQANGFIISADTLKDGTDDLEFVYGDKILGLTNDSIAELRPEIIERLLPLVRRAILT